METKKLMCSVCQSEFWTRGNTAKYCSPECRKAGRYYGPSVEGRYKKVQKAFYSNFRVRVL